MTKFILPFIAICVCISCSPSLAPFTSQDVKSNHWTDEHLRAIQYYTSDDILIHREFQEGGSEIIQGKIKTINGRKVEEILIPARSPGVMIQALEGNKLAISFEEGQDHRFLIFGPHPERRGVYVLLAKNYKNGVGEVEYGGEKYWTAPGSNLAFLLVDKNNANDYSRTRSRAGGRVIK